LLEERLLFRVRLSSLETVVIINKAHPYLYIVNNIVYTVYYHVKEQKIDLYYCGLS
jgi:hypothetical protein